MMKANRIFAMVAFAATTLFAASCAKDDNNSQNEKGEPARMGLKIAFPQTTKAADSNASVQDLKVTSINVYVFETDGTAADGNNTVQFSDFVKLGDAYELSDDKLITTTAGDKKVYVGLNLPAGLNNITSEATLKAVFESPTLLFSNTDTEKGPAMINSVAETKDVLATSLDNNKVSVEVSRMVAKLTVKNKTTDNWTYSPSEEPTATYTVTPDMFTTGNLAASVYPLQRTANDKLVTPGDVNNVKPTEAKSVTALALGTYPMTPISAPNMEVGNRPSLYIPEHSTSSLYLRKESTAAIIRGELIPTKFTTVNTDGELDETEAFAASAGDEVYVINFGGRVSFTKDANDRGKVLAFYNQADTANNYDTYIVAANGKLYTFYYIFVARDEIDQLAVKRNVVYDIAINSVKTIGQPGDPAQPDQPDDEDDNGEEPVYETEAKLDITVTVANWQYSEADANLE